MRHIYIIAISFFSVFSAAAQPTIDSSQVAQQQMNEAIAHYDGQRYEQALRLLQSAISYNNRADLFDILYYYRALTRLQLKEDAAAQADLDTAIQYLTAAKIEKPHYYLQRAKLRYEAQNFERAEQDLLQTIQPTTKATYKAEAYMLLATLCLRRNQPEQALVQLNTALGLQPNYAEALYYRAFVYYQLLQPKDACADLYQAAQQGHQLAQVAYKQYCR
jgi:tetratricopeptide (TPR) repeat protein